MINKLALLPLLLISSLCLAQDPAPQWYAGITAGFNHTDNEMVGEEGRITRIIYLGKA